MADTWEKMNQKVIDFMQKGQLQEAMAVAHEALDLAVRENGEEHQTVAVTLNNLGELYHMVEDYV